MHTSFLEDIYLKILKGKWPMLLKLEAEKGPTDSKLLSICYLMC